MNQFNVANMVFREEVIFQSNYAILLSSRPLKEYKDNVQTDKIIGTSVTVCAPMKEFGLYTVKLEGVDSLPITNEEIKNAISQINFPYVVFEGFQGRTYKKYDSEAKKEETLVTCSAKGMKLVSREDLMSEIDLFGGDN